MPRSLSDALFETETLNFLKAVTMPDFSRVSVRHAAEILEQLDAELAECNRQNAALERQHRGRLER
jgi:hypothetical protein